MRVFRVCDIKSIRGHTESKADREVMHKEMQTSLRFTLNNTFQAKVHYNYDQRFKVKATMI